MGFDVSLLFVVGTPGETPEDVECSILLAEKYPVLKAFFFNLIPFPGTPLFRWVEEHDRFVAPYDDLINRKDELKLRALPFFETDEMSYKDRVLALARTERVSKRIQVRAMERKLSRWGFVGWIIAQCARYDSIERRFIANRFLRAVLDSFVFRRTQTPSPGGM